MDSILGALAIGTLLAVLVIYVLIGLFLNSFSKLVDGNGTIFAFIPIGNLYLLGYLTFNGTVGTVLVLSSFAVSLLTFKPLYESLFAKWLPIEVVNQISTYYTIFFAATLLMGIVKYIGLKFSPDEKKKSSFKEDNQEEQSKYENDQIITDSHNSVSGGYDSTSEVNTDNIKNKKDDLIFTNDDSPLDETPSVGVSNDFQDNSSSEEKEEDKEKGSKASDLENFFN